MTTTTIEPSRLVQKGLDLGLDIDPGNHDEDAVRDTVELLEADGVAEALASAKIASQEVGEMSNDQRERLRAAKATKSGLRGKALATWIRTGDSGGEAARAALAAQKGEPQLRGLRPGSTMDAILTVLKGAKEPLTAKEVYARIKKRNLAPNLGGKTPEASVAARLNVATARGLYDIVRPQPGRFALKTKGGK